MGNSLILKIFFQEENFPIVADGIKFVQYTVKKYEIPCRARGGILIDHVAKCIVVDPTNWDIKRIPFSEGVVKGYREIRNNGTHFDPKELALQALKYGAPTLTKTAGAAL